MIKKTYNKKKTSCKVTFRFHPDEDITEIETVQVVGNFNEWGQAKRHFLKRRKDGTYSLSLNLKSQKEYEFRYLINDSQWITDTEADKCIWNIFGSQNALIEV